eukprot:5429164-Pyramimonas_sp.AAC.2
MMLCDASKRKSLRISQMCWMSKPKLRGKKMQNIGGEDRYTAAQLGRGTIKRRSSGGDEGGETQTCEL